MRDLDTRGPVSIHRLRQSLDEREQAIIGSIERFRYMSSRQVELLHFADQTASSTAARKCRRVLERLSRTGLIWRLDRRNARGSFRQGAHSAAFDSVVCAIHVSKRLCTEFRNAGRIT